MYGFDKAVGAAHPYLRTETTSTSRFKPLVSLFEPHHLSGYYTEPNLPLTVQHQLQSTIPPVLITKCTLSRTVIAAESGGMAKKRACSQLGWVIASSILLLLVHPLTDVSLYKGLRSDQ
jgi:hypothetical protein